jgi:Fur family ferric uptake transcriptional regulator
MRKVLACGRPTPTKQRTKLGEIAKHSLREKLQSHIKGRDLNQSESRNQILEVILDLPAHFSIGELLRRVQELYPNIGTATVYRNMPNFTDAGILRETLTDEQGLKVYEIAEEEHHDHIVCLDCGHIFEFHDEAIEKAQDKLSSHLQFTPVHHKHVMYAHCQMKR